MAENPPVPGYLKAKATRLPAGHDGTLDPPAPPTDPARRQAPPSSWPTVDTSRGSTDPPDGPLSAPATDPASRSVPAFIWARGLPEAAPNRSLVLTLPQPDLDPDVAMWPSVTVSRWPFTGAPTEGIWPLGWFGIDNTATPYVCVSAGEPGTWAALTSGEGVNATQIQGVPVSSTAPMVGQLLQFNGTDWIPATETVGTPVGLPQIWPGPVSTIPANWLELNGQTVTGGVTTYPALAAAWPALVSGSNLVLPNWSGLFPVGSGGSIGLSPGQTGGAVSNTLTTANIPQFSAVAVTLPNLAHTHTGTTATETQDHGHPYNESYTEGIGLTPGTSGYNLTVGNSNADTGYQTALHDHTFETNSALGSPGNGSVTFGSASPSAVTNVPPCVAGTWIVKAA